MIKNSIVYISSTVNEVIRGNFTSIKSIIRIKSIKNIKNIKSIKRLLGVISQA